MRALQGVTLIEMLTALTLIAVTGAAAIPAFNQLRRNSERDDAVNRLYHALFLARSEALTRGEMVTVCKSRDGSSCARRGVDWDAGWLVFVNSDRDEPPVLDPGESTVAAYSGWPHGRATSTRLAFSFRPYMQGVVNGTVVFCDARGPEHARAIIVSHAGRARIAKRDSRGRPLRCPA